MDRVLRGRIFRNIAAIVRGNDQPSPTSIAGPDAVTYTRDNNPRKPEASQTGSLSFLGDCVGNNRKRKTVGMDEMNMSTNTINRKSNADDEQKYSSRDSEDPEVSSPSHLYRKPDAWNRLDPPPLTSPYLKIFTFPGDHGEISSGLALTDTLVYQLNVLYQTQQKIRLYTQKIDKLDQDMNEIGDALAEVNNAIEMREPGEQQDVLLDDLQGVENMMKQCQDEREMLETKIQLQNDERQDPMSMMLVGLQRVLGANGLLQEVTPSESEDQDLTGDDNMDEAFNDMPSPTASEYARRKWHDGRDNALNCWQDCRFTFQDARGKLEEWHGYYADQEKIFDHENSQCGMRMSKTEFDVKLVYERHLATQELTNAEKGLCEAEKHCRELRIDFHDDENESGFLDQTADGFVSSMAGDQAAKLANSDRPRVEKWLAKDTDELLEEVDVDEWEYKSVTISDSISLAATGRYRERIDQWRTMNERIAGETHTEIQ